MTPMPAVLEVLPNEQVSSVKREPIFPTEEAHGQFREWCIDEVSGEMERLQEARRKSEEESRQRLLR